MSDLDKKYPLRLDTRINFKNLIPHFYISDNQTNDFYIKLTNDNKPVEVEDIIVVIAVINPNGNINSSFLDTKTEKGLIYCNLPNELKNVVGVYKARIMCISGEERIVSNTFEYKVDTDEFQVIDEITEDSEEMIVLSQMLSRLSNMEIESQANETERTANENERIANEAERIENENLRQQAENNRNTTEEARVVAESNRISNESERVLGEQTRVENEQNRISAENKRISDENIRKENENRRLEKENNNVQAELNRVQAESNRVQAELKREQSESNRKNSENARNDNEDIRKQNELKRQSNENTRITNESTRIANEAVRVSNEDKRHATALANEKRINDLYNDTVSKTNKLVQDVNLSINNIIDDATTRTNELIEDTTTKTNKVIEDATTNVNELIEDINTSVESYAEAEAQRQANEDERIANENERAKVNANRQQAEQTRVTNERNRKDAETARASAERNRVNNESVRISNENIRKNNEEKRKEEFKAKMIEVDNALASLETPDMNTLTKNNTEEFIPTGDYNPATKKYVDDSVLNKVEIIYDKIVVYNDDYNILKNSTLENYVISYLNDYYCYEYDLPSEDIYSNLNYNLRPILNKCREVAIANNDIVEIICAGISEGITNYYFYVRNNDFSIYIDDYAIGVVNIQGDFESGVCTRTKKTSEEYVTKEYVDSNIPCKTVDRNELFRITSDEINHSLGESKLIFTITNSNIINENKRYMVRFSYKEKLGYLSDGVLNFNFETYTIDICKSNDNTFKITINNFPTEFAGVEGEPTVTDLVLYEEEIQFINEKYLPNTVASKKYVDEHSGTGTGVYVETLIDNLPLSEFITNKTIDETSSYAGVYNMNRILEIPDNENYNYYLAVQTLEYDNKIGRSRFMKIARSNVTNKLNYVSVIGDGNTSFNKGSIAYKICDYKIAIYNEENSKITYEDSETNSYFAITISKSNIKDRFDNIEGYTADNFLQTKVTVKMFIVDKNINTTFPIYANESGGLLSIDNLFDYNTYKVGTESISMGISNSTGNNTLVMGNTNDVGKFDLVAGFNNIITGYNSSAIGANNNISSATNGYAYGDNLKITEPYTLGIGKYADIPSDLMFALGNGTSEEDKKVIFGIERNTGLPVVESEPTANNHLVNKKYVDDKTASIDTTINNTLPSNGSLNLTTSKIQTTTLAIPTDIILPTVTGYTEIHLLFEGVDGVTITTGVTTVRWQSALTIEQGKVYEIVFTYVNDTIGWLANYIIYN